MPKFVAQSRRSATEVLKWIDAHIPPADRAREFDAFPIEKWPVGGFIDLENEEPDVWLYIRQPGRQYELVEINGEVRPAATGSVIEATLPSPPPPYRMPILTGLASVAVCALTIWNPGIVPHSFALVAIPFFVILGFLGRAGQAERVQHVLRLERFLSDAAAF